MELKLTQGRLLQIIFKFIQNQKGRKVILLLLNRGDRYDSEKYTTTYLAVYGKILQVHLHNVIQMRGESEYAI